MLISEGYRALNKELHERRPDYGASGAKWAGRVAEAAKRIGCSRGFLWKQCDENKIPYSMFGSKMYIPAKYIEKRITEAMGNQD